MVRPTGTKVLADSHAGNHGKRLTVNVDECAHLFGEFFDVKNHDAHVVLDCERF